MFMTKNASNFKLSVFKTTEDLVVETQAIDIRRQLRILLRGKEELGERENGARK